MKNTFKNSIIYYYKYLLSVGCNDPLKVIISEFLETIDLPDIQRDHILSITGKNKELLDNVHTIIKGAKKKNNLSKSDIDVIEKTLSYILNKKPKEVL